MDRPPVPPTALPDAPRSEGADANRRSGSAYRGLDARESSAKYIGQLRSISVQLIVMLLANLVVMLWAVRLERYVLYLVALALTLVAAFVTRLRKVKLFTGLSPRSSARTATPPVIARRSMRSPSATASAAPRTPLPSSSRTATTLSSIAPAPCAASSPSASSVRATRGGSARCRSSSWRVWTWATSRALGARWIGSRRFARTSRRARATASSPMSSCWITTCCFDAPPSATLPTPPACASA